MIAAEVFLWGTRIGFIAQETVSSIPRFNYDKEFLRSGMEVAPLMMPLSERVYSFPGLSNESFHMLPGLLSDSLPDKFGTRILMRYLSEQGRDLASLSAVERLCYTGTRGMGALEYVPSLSFTDHRDEQVDIDALVRLASDILTERKSLRLKEDKNAMEQLIQIGTSAGGARAKALVAWNEETGDIRSGQVDSGKGYGYWLIKFDGVENNKDKGDRADGVAYTRIEYAYYLMALRAGIEMNPFRIYESNGNYHFMTRRFDRDEETGGKRHMQTLGALAHFDYNEPGVHGYEQVADILYRLGMGQQEIALLFRRMVFNVLALNHDDHVKNISFLMDRDGVWGLAPAYDITYSCDPANYWLQRHQMSVSGKTEEITEQDIEACGRRMNLSAAKIKSVVGDVRDAVSQWKAFAQEANVPEEAMERIAAQLL